MSEQTSSDTGTVTSTVDRKSDPRDLVSRFRSMWRGDQAPDALEFLAEHSSVRENRALSLELAYEEYCVRRENGESLDIAVFCERFPSISRSLHRQIEVDEYIRGHPSIIGQEVAVAWPRRGDALAGFVVVEEIGRGAFARVLTCVLSLASEIGTLSLRFRAVAPWKPTRWGLWIIRTSCRCTRCRWTRNRIYPPSVCPSWAAARCTT